MCNCRTFSTCAWFEIYENSFTRNGRISVDDFQLRPLQNAMHSRIYYYQSILFWCTLKFLSNWFGPIECCVWNEMSASRVIGNATKISRSRICYAKNLVPVSVAVVVVAAAAAVVIRTMHIITWGSFLLNAKIHAVNPQMHHRVVDEKNKSKRESRINWQHEKQEEDLTLLRLK